MMLTLSCSRQDTASNLASGVAPRQWACVAGVGLAISQDDELRFVVEAVAPGGGAEEEGTIKVGDVITTVDGVPCVNTRGLSQAQIEGIRQMPPDNGEESAAGEPGNDCMCCTLQHCTCCSLECSHSARPICGRGDKHVSAN